MDKPRGSFNLGLVAVAGVCQRCGESDWRFVNTHRTGVVYKCRGCRSHALFFLVGHDSIHTDSNLKGMAS